MPQHISNNDLCTQSDHQLRVKYSIHLPGQTKAVGQSLVVFASKL